MIPVLHVIHKFDRRAGPDVLVAELLARLDRRRWAPSVALIDFALFDGPSLLEQRLPDDVPLHRVPWGGLGGLPRAMRAMRRIHRVTGARLVHSHDIPSHLVSAAAGGPRVASVHGIVDQTGRQRQWNRINAALLRRADRVIVSSDPVAAALGRAIRGRQEVLLNAIDTDAIAPNPPRPPRTPGDPLRVICVARLSAEKAHADLIEAVRLVADPRLRLDVLGTGPLLDPLRAQAGAVPGVTVHGFVEDASPWFREADLFALASIRESLSIGVLEAMAHGLPVLTTDVGAHPAVVGESGAGRVVPAGSPPALAAALRGALDDPEAFAAMGRRGRDAVVSRHSMDHFASRTAAIYAEVLEGRGAR